MAQIGKYLYEVPGKDEFCKIDRHGKSVLPSGRYVEPAGKTVSITKGAFGMAVATNDSIAITLHNGVLHIIPLNQPEQNIRIPSYDKNILQFLRVHHFWVWPLLKMGKQHI